jgi:hypothetical protein
MELGYRMGLRVVWERYAVHWIRRWDLKVDYVHRSRWGIK